MKKLIIHIGFAKTGSTSIQRFLASNRKLLLQKGVLYPLESDGRDDSYFLYDLLYCGKFKEAQQKLADYFQESNTVLLSSEFFPNCVDGFSAITEGVDEVKIICFVRRQDLWLESSYQQSVKGVNNPEMGKMVRGITESATDYVHNFSKNSADWYRNIERWAAAFGNEALIVKHFCRRSFKNSSLEEELLSLLGFEDEIGFCYPPTSQNESLSYTVTEMIRLFNEVLPENIAPAGWILFKEVLNHQANLKSEKSAIFTEELRDEFLESFKESNKNLCKKYLKISYDEFIRPVSNTNNSKTALTVEDTIPHLMGMIYRQSHKIEKLHERILKLESERK